MYKQLINAFGAVKVCGRSSSAGAWLGKVTLTSLRMCVAGMVVQCGSLGAQESKQPSVPDKYLINAVERLRAARQNGVVKEKITDRVRDTTWQLLVGEIAANPEHGLYSSAYDALSGGLEQLDKLLQDLEKDPQQGRELAQDTQLTMRLDAAVARRNQAIEKKDVSRQSELDRLKQIREMNAAYRDLARQLVLLNTEMILGRPAEIKKFGAEASATLAKVEAISGQRRDFYLFQDEPVLEGDDSSELKLVKELVAPLANDVQTHQKSLQAIMMARVALVSPADIGQKLLGEAKALADESVRATPEPDLLAYYAKAICCRELGRFKTTPAPLAIEKHKQATGDFDEARVAFTKALAKAQEMNVSPQLLDEIDNQNRELQGPEVTLVAAAKFTQSGRIDLAVERLEYGLTLHASEPIVLALISAHVRSGRGLTELQKHLAEIDEGHILQSDSSNYLLCRGRSVASVIWQQLLEPNGANPAQNSRPTFAAKLIAARKDLLQAGKHPNTAAPVVLQAKAFLGFVEAGLLLLDEKATPEIAVQVASELSTVIDDLKQLIRTASPEDAVNFREAIVASHLAQGYIALRTSPEYRDTAQRAFAAAEDAASQLPYSGKVLKVLGTPALQALWGRPEAKMTQLAQEERHLRQTLQRLLPAAFSLQFGSADQAASHLERVVQQLQDDNGEWTAGPNLGRHETLDARETVAGEGRMLAVLGLLASGKATSALRQSVSPWFLNLTDSQLATLSPHELESKLKQQSNSLLIYGVAASLEEYATKVLPVASAQSRELIQLAYRLQVRIGELLKQSAGEREQFPYLVQLNQIAKERLAGPEYYVQEASRLRRGLRLTEAREILDQGTRRHPDAQSLLNALAETYIDEASFNSEAASRLLAEALSKLESNPTAGQHPSVETLLLLGALRERLGRIADAAGAYQQVLKLEPTAEQKTRARSRLALLKLKLASR